MSSIAHLRWPTHSNGLSIKDNNNNDDEGQVGIIKGHLVDGENNTTTRCSRLGIGGRRPSRQIRRNDDDHHH